MDAAAELGRNHVSTHQIQHECGDEQADAGRDCRNRLARPNSQAHTGTRKYSFSLLSLLGSLHDCKARQGRPTGGRIDYQHYRLLIEIILGGDVIQRSINIIAL